ncbi:MAG: DNA adenine methylase [Bacteroidota bacterium]
MKHKEFFKIESSGYLGGKSAEGTYQTIINQIPSHRTYVEGCLGHGSIMRKKKPAEFQIGIDLDSEVIEVWKHAVDLSPLKLSILQASILELELPCFYERSTFVYLDPPYLHSKRRSSHRYNFELSNEEHLRLLQRVKEFDCMIAISCYDSGLYQDELRDWRRIHFDVMTRGGTMATETLYMNYAAVPPKQLHDKRFLGDNYRTRENTRKRLNTIHRKIQRLDIHEKAMLIDELTPLIQSMMDHTAVFVGADLTAESGGSFSEAIAKTDGNRLPPKMVVLDQN